MLLGCVALILETIALLKKGKRYNKFTRGVIIALKTATFSIATYLVHLAFVFSNSHPSATPVPIW